MSEVLLFDVEGTTTAIDFVHKTLFPYSKERIPAFVKANAHLPVIANLHKEFGTTEQVVETLLEWIATDKKESRLKELQGLIWDIGYQCGDFKGHVYPDVRHAFEKWKAEGKTIAIYSSGSVHAQKCIFKYSIDGDLTPFISAYFDTAVGGKREPSSYDTIARELKILASGICFFSDIKEELDAAKLAGLDTVQVFRDGPSFDNGHAAIAVLSQARV